MSRGYQLTPTAQANVEQICAFIAEDSIDAALRVLNALEHAFEELAAMPGMGHSRHDLTDRPLKFWGVYSCTTPPARHSPSCMELATSSIF